MSSNTKFTVKAIGEGFSYGSETDYQTLKLMIKAKFVTINGRTIEVKAFEVVDNGDVNFYGAEVEIDKETKEIKSEFFI
jgi:hypothetical protein